MSLSGIPRHPSHSKSMTPGPQNRQKQIERRKAAEKEGTPNTKEYNQLIHDQWTSFDQIGKGKRSKEDTVKYDDSDNELDSQEEPSDDDMKDRLSDDNVSEYDNNEESDDDGEKSETQIVDSEEYAELPPPKRVRKSSRLAMIRAKELSLSMSMLYVYVVCLGLIHYILIKIIYIELYNINPRHTNSYL